MFKEMKSCKRILNATSVSLALIGVTATPLQAVAHEHQAQARASAVQSGDDMKVVRDAETGKLRAPTAEEDAVMEKVAKTKNARFAAPATLQKWHASGARGARLTDEFMSASVAVRNPDGSLSQQCFDSHEAAEGATKAAGNTATKLETE